MANLTNTVKKLILACETKNDGSPTLFGDGCVDTLGWGHATFTLFLGAIAAGANVNLKIQESDLPGSGYVDVDGKALSEIDADSGDEQCYVIEVPLAARKRYLKPVCVVDDGAPGAALAIEAELSAFSTSAAADIAAAAPAQVV